MCNILTGYREENDLLVGPLFGGIVADGNTAGGDVARILRVWDVATTDGEYQSHIDSHASLLRARCNLRENNIAGEAVTGLEGRHIGW
jgi:hypothetical protein